VRPLREIINAAREGKRISRAEKVLLGEQLNAYWVDRCDDCRHAYPCDDLFCERCPDCRERYEREGSGA